jgi:CxxC motif-containing protein
VTKKGGFGMEVKEFPCIICPSGCRLRVTAEGKEIVGIEGFSCKRGEQYARSEFLAPVRMVTSTVKAIGYKSEVISVRTDKPIPKELMFRCMDEIRKVTVGPPFEIGRVVIENVLGTGSNIILSNN